MYVRLGSLRFGDGLVSFTTDRRTEFGTDGRPATERNRVHLRGQLFGTSQADIAAKCALMEATCRRQFVDVVVVRDDGGVALALTNSTSLTGVRIVDGPNYPVGDGGFEFVSGRTFELTAEADYPAAPQVNVIVYEQRVRVSGGLPAISFLAPKRGKPYRVIDAEQTPYFATQQGSAVGLVLRPTPPPPLWPAALMTREVENTDPQRSVAGPRNYGIAWTYTFGSENPLR